MQTNRKRPGSERTSLTYDQLQPRQLLAGVNLALYEFTNHESGSPDLVSTDTHTFSTASEITSLLPLSSTGNGEPPRGLALGSSFNESSEPTPAGGQNDYFEFTLTPNAGFEASLSRFSMQVRKNDPDSKDSYSVYFDDDPGAGGNNFSTRILTETITSEDTFETLSVDLETYPELTTLTAAVTFRVYSWGTVGLGTARIDNVRVQEVQTNVTGSKFAYYGESGRLIFPLDELGNRVADFSAAGYKNGNESIPNVTKTIDSSRIVNVSPVADDDMATIQAAINQVAAMTVDANGFRGIVQLSAGEFQISDQLLILDSGIVLRGIGDGDDPVTDTILRATGTTQRSLVVVGQNAGSANPVANTTHNIVDKYVPVGATSLIVDSTDNWNVGDQVVVYRPSTTEWISAIGMDMIPDDGDVVQWSPGDNYDHQYERVITRIEGNRVFFDAPVMNSLEQQFGGGIVYRYDFSTPRINQIGIENIRGVSDFASDTDENHARTFIELLGVEDAWVTNVTGQHFVYATVHATGRSLRVTVDDAASLEPKSIITGGRRYAFTIDGQLILMQNLFSEDGRHDFVNNSPRRNRGPNVFLNGTAVNSNSSSGPHQRWSTGTLYDTIETDNQIEARNRGSFGTGHGWAGANMVFWNSVSTSFIAQNPPTAQNWVIGGSGIITDETRFGQQELANFDAHETPIDFERANNPTSSLYVAQRIQADSESAYQGREYLLGDFDLGQFDGTGTADEIFANALWQSEVITNAGGLLINLSDESEPGQVVPFSFEYELGKNEHVYSAVLTLGLRGTGGDTTDDSLWVESSGNLVSFSSLGLTDSLPVDETTVVTIEILNIDLDMLGDGLLNLAVAGDSVLDWSNLEILVGQGTSQIVDGDPTANQVFENAAVGETVGLTAQAIDPDPKDTVNYRMIDDSSGRFQIDVSTGTVTVAGKIDFELNSKHSIVVEAFSTDGSSRTQSFEIAVLNVADGLPETQAFDNSFLNFADASKPNRSHRPTFYQEPTGNSLGVSNAVSIAPSSGAFATYENYSKFSSSITRNTWTAHFPTTGSSLFETDGRILLTWDNDANEGHWRQTRNGSLGSLDDWLEKQVPEQSTNLFGSEFRLLDEAFSDHLRWTD